LSCDETDLYFLLDSSNMSSLHYSSTPQLQEIRNRIRAAGPSQSAQIGMVVNELASLMAEVAPRLREAATQLRENNQSEVAYLI
jgi:hypothetical protein